MRLPFLFVCVCMMTGVLQAAPPIDSPPRMTGLWLLNTSDAHERAPDYYFCVEKGSENPLLNPAVRLEQCDNTEWTGDWMFRNVTAQCRDTLGTFTVQGRFEGDFQYSYQGKLVLQFDPPRNGVVTQSLLYEGRRVAPCRQDVQRGVFLRSIDEGFEPIGQ